MNPEDRLQAMEEELMKHRMKSDAIEISLQAILDKLNILPRKEDVMQSKLDFRKPESKECLGDSQRKADEGTVGMHWSIPYDDYMFLLLFIDFPLCCVDYVDPLDVFKHRCMCLSLN